MTAVASPQVISSYLVKTLMSTSSLNSFFEKSAPQLCDSFGANRSILIDYRESSDRFVLLHWLGYSSQSRHELQRRLFQMDLRQSLTQLKPYFDGTAHRLFVPLYFMTTLEAVIVFESDQPMQMTQPRSEIAAIVSKFVGMMLSSSRLPINQLGLVDLNDLQRARQIQLTYLPADNLQTDRYEVYGYNQSSALVGGDYFDYFRLRDHSIQCVLADACGHGLAAALIMSAFRAALHADINEWPDCGDLFSNLNRAIHTGSTTVQYLTGVFLDFDEQRNRVRYTNAGHFEPALIRADASIERLGGGGPPLGMFEGSLYSSVEATIHSGDLLVLFTDGVTDLRNASDDLYGEERILECARQHRTRPLKEIASVLLNEGLSFSASPQPEDDLTLFLVRFH